MHLGGVVMYDLASSRAIRRPMARCVQMGNSRWRMTAYEEGVRDTAVKFIFFKVWSIIIAAVLGLGISMISSSLCRS